ncbi:hypothetical protein [Sphingorhabdus sp. Alg239-R122]|uniref:hypothetical protein n=1 Tax=Sphingorhabdus sp. Alg239-R122 TaxID=2305989 RepID=UPI0013DB9104|nr:hypothetical protein [Sphingorhabdus sp. Alg239-R122]
MTFNNSINGGIYGATGNFAGQLTNRHFGYQESINLNDVAWNFAVGSTVGAIIPDVKFYGVNKGLGPLAQYKSLNTRYNNGQIAVQVRPEYAIKGGLANPVNNVGRQYFESVYSSYPNGVQNLEKDR